MGSERQPGDAGLDVLQPLQWSWPAGSSAWKSGENTGTGPVRDFSVTMPRLLSADIDFNSLPYQLQVALSFLRSLCPRDHVPDDHAARLPALLPPQLPEHRGRKVLVLDLDETLVHCHPTLLQGSPPPALQVWIDVANPPLHAHVYVRPFAPIFLEVVARVFEVVIFTASASIYADKVLDFLDPQRRCVAHRLYRQHCTELFGGLFKDLRRLGRNQDDIVLVDNSPLAAGITPESAIICSSWFGDTTEDMELLDLLDVLERCATCRSVPAFLEDRYGFASFLDHQRAPVPVQVPAPVASGGAGVQQPPLAALLQACSGPVTQVQR